MPPLDESLAAHLLPQAAGWAEGRKPLPPLPRDREILEYLDKMFRLGMQMGAAANNLGVLGVSLITPQQDIPASPPPDGSDYLDCCVGQTVDGPDGMATAAGRVMSLATVVSRHVWLGLTALRPPYPRKGSSGRSPRSPSASVAWRKRGRSSAACCRWLFLGLLLRGGSAALR